MRDTRLISVQLLRLADELTDGGGVSASAITALTMAVVHASVSAHVIAKTDYVAACEHFAGVLDIMRRAHADILRQELHIGETRQ